jgi:GDP-L-fucose synthase
MALPQAVYQQHTQPMLSHINVGSGVDCTVRELAETIARITGYSGRLVWDTSKPDGTPRKLMDVSRLAALGWRSRIGLEDGLRDAYRWFIEHRNEVRA